LDDRPLGDTRRDRALLFAAVALVAFLAHWGVLGAPFIWDDQPLIVKSEAVRRLSHIPAFFAGETLAPEGALEYHIYRPVRAAYLTLVYVAFNGHPLAFHLGNLLLHMLAAVLVCALVNALFRQRALAAMAGLLFAVHPTHVEAVTWIKNAGELLALVMALVAFLFLLDWTRKPDAMPQRIFYLLSVLAFTLALLAKESAVTLPVVWLAWLALSKEWPPGNLAAPRPARILLAVLPHFLVSAAYAIFQCQYVRAQQGPAPASPATAADIGGRLPLVVHTVWTYLGLLVLPVHLNPWRDLAPAGGLGGVAIVLLGVAAGLAFLFVVWAQRRWKPLFLGLVWMVTGLAPAANLLAANRGRPIAEQRLYLPSVGWCLVLAVLFWAGISRARLRFRRAAGLAFATTVLLLLVLTAHHTTAWSSDVTFWRRVVALSPGLPQAQSNLGSAYFTAGRIAQAAAQFQRAARALPDNAKTLNDVGAAYLAMGQPDRAARVLRRAIQMRPVYAKGLENLVRALAGLDSLEEARLTAAQMLQRSGGDAGIRRIYADVLTLQRRYQEAIVEYERALREQPDDFLTLLRAGDAYRANGNYARAEELHRRAVAISPRQAEAHHALGVDLEQLGRYEEALTEFQRACALAPDRLNSRAHAGRLLHKLGRHSDSLREYELCLAYAEKQNAAPEVLALIHEGIERAAAALGQAEKASRHRHAAERLRGNP